MSVTDVLYQVRTETLEQIERGRINLLRCRVYDAGQLVAPTASGSTITIYDASNTAIISAAAVTVASSEAQYSLAAAATSSLSRGDGWRIEWTLVLADGTTRVIRQDAALVTRRLLPPAVMADIFRRVPSLDPDGDHPIHTMTLAELDPFLDDAWLSIEAQLIATGRLPWLVSSPQALREVHILSTLAIMFGAFATRLGTAFMEQAADYRAQLREAWAAVRLVYDPTDEGQPTSKRTAAQPSVWLMAHGSHRNWSTP